MLNETLANEIVSYQDDKSYKTILGGTMSTDDFYEGTCSYVALKGCVVCTVI